MSSKYPQGHGYTRERDSDRRVDYGRDSRGRESKKEDRHHHRSHREGDGDRGKDYDRGTRSNPAHHHSRSRDAHESRSPQRDRGGAFHTGTTPNKGGTPGPKGNSVLAELLRQAKARQQQEGGGAGAGGGASGSGSDGEAPEAGEILPQGGAAQGSGGAGGSGPEGRKRRYHSPIVWNLDGPGDTAAGRPPPPKRPASASAVARAAEELAAFRRAQQDAELGYDPEGPPAVKASPSVSGSEDGHGEAAGDGGRRGRSADRLTDTDQRARTAEREADSERAAREHRWQQEEDDAEGDAQGGRPAGGSRWADDAEAEQRGAAGPPARGRAGAGAGGAEGGERRQEDREGVSGSPRRAGSTGDTLSGRDAAGGRGSSSSRSPGPAAQPAEGRGGRGGDDGGGSAEGDESLVSQQIATLAECRSVDEYERLNRISEGTYGVVFRARCKRTGRICALKKIKMEKERDGFPVTSIREINILLNLHHPNIVNVSEVVMGSRLDQIYMVMEFMDHDLKSLMNDKQQMVRSFSVAEAKCLMRQLLSGIEYLHQNWVIHRDLKTSNILYNNHGELKICDFGLARQFGSPLRPYTQPVVTLWYRPPELLLGETHYSTAVDMWSIGCIMAELLTGKPLFDGQGEIEQLDKICGVLGTPNEDVWPGVKKLPNWGKIVLRPQPSQLRQRFTSSFSSGATLTEAGFDLLSRLLAYDPQQRITATEALEHRWFSESPYPQRRELMPTFRSNKDGSGAVRQAAMTAPGSPPLQMLALMAR